MNDDHDTSIHVQGANAPTISNATIGNGNTLSITAATGNPTDQIMISNLFVKPGDFGRLSLADPDNLALAKLDVHGASFTFVLPEGIGDGDAFMEVAGAADVDEVNLNMAGPGLEGLGANDEVALIAASALSGTPAAESGEAPFGATRLIISAWLSIALETSRAFSAT